MLGWEIHQVRCNSWMDTLAMVVRKGFSEEVIFKMRPEWQGVFQEYQERASLAGRRGRNDGEVFWSMVGKGKNEIGGTDVARVCKPEHGVWILLLVSLEAIKI